MERAEKIGLGIAVAGHVVLFGLLSVGFLVMPNPLKLRHPPVEVQFVDEVAPEASTPNPSAEKPATSVAPELGTPEEQAEPQPAAPAPAPQKAEVPPAPAPAPKAAEKPAPSKPAPAAPAKPKQEAKPAPKPAPAPAKPTHEAKPKPAAHGARLGPDFLKGITDAPSTSRSQTPALSAPVGPAIRNSLAAELRRQLKPHWRAPSGADVEKLRVTVVATLAPDGSLAGEPHAEPIEGVTPSNRAQAALFVERAIAAVKLGAPYKLPSDYYSAWKVIRPQFDKSL